MSAGFLILSYAVLFLCFVLWVWAVREYGGSGRLLAFGLAIWIASLVLLAVAPGDPKEKTMWFFIGSSMGK